MKLLVPLILLSGCVGSNLKVEPVKVEPIHMTIDINLHDGKDAARPASPPRQAP